MHFKGVKLNIFVLDIALFVTNVLSFQHIYISVKPGNGVESPGLYGGLINTTNLGEGSNLYVAGYNCMKFEDNNDVAWMNGLNVLSTNYDPISELILIQTSQEEDRNVLSVGMGPLCGYVDCNGFPIMSTLLNVNSMSHSIGPFSFFDSELYFISHHSYTTNSATFEVVDLRQAETCDVNFPLKDKRLNFTACSSSIAEVMNRPVISSTHYYPGNSMYKIVTSSALLFYLQIFKVEHDVIIEVELYDISADTNRPRLLHKEENLGVSPPAKLIQTEGGLGGMSYKDNRLCWTTLTKVHCALWNSRTPLSDKRVVLTKTEITNFCGASMGMLDEDWVVQDLSLADTYHPFVEGRELYLYFTCLHPASGINGPTGLVRMNETGEKTLYPVTSNGRTVRGGSLFLQRSYSRHCPDPTTPPGGGGPDGGNGPTPPPNLAPAVKSAFTVIAVGLAVQMAIYIYLYYKQRALFPSPSRGPPPDIHL